MVILGVVTGPDPAARRRFAGEMERVLSRWSAAHDGLRVGNRSESLPGRKNRPVRSAFEEVDPFFRRMRDAARELSAAGGDPASSLAQLLATEGDDLDRMDRIVGLDETETRARVEAIRRTGGSSPATQSSPSGAPFAIGKRCSANPIRRRPGAGPRNDGTITLGSANLTR